MERTLGPPFARYISLALYDALQQQLDCADVLLTTRHTGIEIKPGEFAICRATLGTAKDRNR
jgi:hypothetical protein